MTPEERERMHILCEKIAIEKDPDKFTELVEALNRLLETKQERIQRGYKLN